MGLDTFTRLFGRPTLPGPVMPGRRMPDPNVDWSQYTPRPRPDLVGPPPSDLREARARLRAFVGERPERLSTLEAFLSSNGVPWGYDDATLTAINVFYADHVHAAPGGSDIAPIWMAVALDLGLLLGDIAIARARPVRRLRWQVRDQTLRKLGETGLRVDFEIGGYPGGCQPPNSAPDRYVLRYGRNALIDQRLFDWSSPFVIRPHAAFTTFLAHSARSARVDL